MGSDFTVPRVTFWLDDGTTHTLSIFNASMTAWEREQARRKWPDATSAQRLCITWMTWHAATAERLIPRMTFEDFDGSCRAIRDDSRADDVADPTVREPGAD